MSIASRLTKLGAARATLPFRATNKPLWRGPEVDGITFSLLARFLVCRERFRILTVEGLKQKERFNHRLEYGNMWHTCEEALAGDRDWKPALEQYGQKLMRRHPLQQAEVEKWYSCCYVEFPVYVKYWAEHEDVRSRTPILQEQSFDIPYRLPSGRVVRLKGKWDAVDLIGKGAEAGVFVQENKAKGNPDERQLRRQLTFDLQTMIYLIAFLESAERLDPTWKRYVGKVKGVRYNVIRRPLSGGKGTIIPHKEKRSKKKTTPAETPEHFFQRLSAIISSSPDFFFQRFQVSVSGRDIERFKQQCFHPVLEALCDWWEWMICKPNDPWACRDGNNRYHFRMPFGVYSPLLDARAGETEMDEYLASGSLAGLERVNTLFPELTTTTT